MVGRAQPALCSCSFTAALPPLLLRRDVPTCRCVHVRGLSAAAGGRALSIPGVSLRCRRHGALRVFPRRHPGHARRQHHPHPGCAQPGGSCPVCPLLPQASEGFARWETAVCHMCVAPGMPLPYMRLPACLCSKCRPGRGLQMQALPVNARAGSSRHLSSGLMLSPQMYLEVPGCVHPLVLALPHARAVWFGSQLLRRVMAHTFHAHTMHSIPWVCAAPRGRPACSSQSPGLGTRQRLCWRCTGAVVRRVSQRLCCSHSVWFSWIDQAGGISTRELHWVGCSGGYLYTFHHTYQRPQLCCCLR